MSGAVGKAKSLDLLTVALVVALAGLAVFGALAAYAISKGYRVRRCSPDGDEWDFLPPDD